jgi:uncharacterized protein (TIGR02145 family)
MKKYLSLFFLVSLFVFFGIQASGQIGGFSNTCTTADPFCGSNVYTFPATVNGVPAPPAGIPGPQYGCLGTQPNPAWYYMMVDQPGNIVIYMYSTPSHDIDFICWGPFSTPTGACLLGLSSAAIVDCSYSPNPTETCTIPNALPGQFYMLLITNFSNQACQITFSQTNYGQTGGGSTNCNLVVHCSVSSLTATASACDPISNTFSVSGNTEFSNAPPTGTLVVTDNTAIPHVQQTFYPPFVSPTNYSLTGISCDGLVHHLTSYFSDSSNCVKSIEFQSPAMICPVAQVSGGGEICNDGISLSNVLFTFLQGSPPFTFIYSINGVRQPTITNYSGPFPFHLITSTAGIYRIDSVANAFCTGTAQDSAVVTLLPLPVVTLADYSPVCIDAPPVALTGGSPPGGTYSGTGVSGGMFTPSTAGPGPHNIIYTYSDSHNCVNRDTASITVLALPLMMATPPAQQHCSGSVASVHFQSDLTATTYAWTATPSSGNVAGFSSGTGDSIHQTLVNTGYSIETVTYTITPTTAGCIGNPVTAIATVYPVPDVIAMPAAPSICSSQATNIVLSSDVLSPSFIWTATGTSGVTGFSGGSGSNIAQTLISTSGVLETVTYHITPEANGCTGLVFNLPVLINPQPHLLNNPMYDTICSGNTTNIHLLSSCLNTTYTWSGLVIAGNIDGVSNGNGTPIEQKLTDLLPTPGDVRYTIIPVAGSCIGNDTNYFMHVLPKPNVTNSTLAYTVCSGTSANIGLTSDVTNAGFTWTATGSSGNVSGYSSGSGVVISQPLTNTGYTTETVTYRVVPSAKGCSGDTVTFTVTVNPVADLSNNPMTKQICSSLPVNVLLTSHVTGAQFTWMATPSSGNVGGYANNAVPSVNLNDLLVNTGNNTETVTYHITPIYSGCTGTAVDFIVTVYPVPHLTTVPLAQTVCTQTLVTVNLTSSVTGSAFNWTCTPSSPNITGWSPGNANQISQTLSNAGYAMENVIYTIIPSANGCAGPATDYTATVNPKPDLSNTPLATQACSGTSPNIALTSHVAGATFSWTATGSSGNITGYGPGSGLVINQVLTNTGFNPESATYHIIPTAYGCSGLSTDYVVTVVQVPDVYFSPTSQTICSQQSCSISLLSHVTNTTFTWTASSGSPGITGFGPGSGITISQPLANSGVTPGTVTYVVSPAVSGCPPGISQNVSVTVNPKPAITNSTTSWQVCNLTPVTITPQSSVSGSNFSWTASGSSANITGYSGGSGLVISQTLQNTGFNQETATYAVTPQANSCDGDPVNFTISVYPVADVYFTPASQSFCSGQTTNIQVQSHVAGASFTWTASGSSGNVSGYFPDSGNTIQQILVNTGYDIETVNYSILPVISGCSGTSGQVAVTVNPLPATSFTTCWDPVLTTDSKPVRLKGGLPPGGTYSGTGIAGGFFNPATAGAGIQTILYSYVNTFGCSRSVSQQINVTAPLGFACGSTMTDPRDNQQYATVLLGTQCWMAINLNYGNTVLSGTMQTDNCVPEKYCYGDISANCASQGALYQWDEVMKFETTESAQGACPPAWHIPSEADWSTLFTLYQGNGFAGSPLKSSGFSGFAAYLNGIRFDNVNWFFNGFVTLFWSSTAHGTNKAWAHGMNQYNPSVSFYPSLVGNAFPVRCIKD